MKSLLFFKGKIMKKIIVISDTHGCKNRVEEIVENERFDYLFFLGDGLKDLERYEQKNIIKVAGNCDIFSAEAKQRVVVIENLKFMLTHGHLYKVKLGLGAIINEAVTSDINIVCYGHTHTQDYQNIDNIIYLNPGSLFNGCYMELCVQNGQIINIITKKG